jgi:signal transduction histidine kinase
VATLSERSKVWVLAVCGLVFAQGVASLLLRQSFPLTVLSDVTQCVLLLSGTAALMPNILRNRGRTRLFWILMTLGLAMWLAYQLLWVYFEVVLRKEVPDPFVGDVVLFLHLVPMMAALALRSHAEQDNRTTRLSTLDFALLLLLWIYLYLYAVLPWQYAHFDELRYSTTFNLLYLTEKTVFLSGLAYLCLVSQGTWRLLYVNWFGASLMYALSSYAANLAIAKQVYYTGSIYDLPLAVSMAWVSIIGIVAQDSKYEQEALSPSKGHGAWVARLGMAAIFALPLFGVWSLMNDALPPEVRRVRIVVTLSAVVVMGAMVFLRQYLLDQELRRLLIDSQESFDNLKTLQTQLVQSEKLASLGQLVGGAAHELNNPLTAMLGYSDLLIATALPEEQRTVAEKIGHQVRRTKALVSSLLSFARQAPTEKVPVDLNSLAQTSVKLSQAQFRFNKVETKLELAAELPRVLGNSNQLLQVFLQLINNAMCSMDEAGGGLLTIRSEEQGGFVSVEIADTISTAISPGNNGAITRAGEPSPVVGPSALYGIIQEHNGRILSQNRAGGGGVYRIELPIVSAAARASTVRTKSWAELESKRSDEMAGVTLPMGPSPQA